MTTLVERDLADAMYAATHTAVTELLRQHHGEHFYYFALVIFPPGYGITFSAWSTGALDATSDDESRADLRWSYADSPYCNFGEQFFEAVNAQSLASTHNLEQSGASDEQFEDEFALKLRAMESALARLDADGAFGIGDRRNNVVILAESVGDSGNTSRVQRLNPPQAAAIWLADQAEPEWIVDVDGSTIYDPDQYRILQEVRRTADHEPRDMVIEHVSEALLHLTVDGNEMKVVHITASAAAHTTSANGVSDLDAITRHFLASIERWPGIAWRDNGWSRRAAQQYRANLQLKRYAN